MKRSTLESRRIKPSPHSEISNLLRHCAYPPLRHRKCGELGEVLTINPGETPGLNTALSPETLDIMRNGVLFIASSFDK